jgi:hypothetical protein
LIVKSLFSLSTVALALMLGISGAMLTASTTDAQARAKAKAKVRPINYEATVAMCAAKTKGMYTFDGNVFARGNCLSKLTY